MSEDRPDPIFVGLAPRSGAELDSWHAAAAPEAALEPALPIIDPHHHIWIRPQHSYLMPDMAAEFSGGHNVRSTVFVQCFTHYRSSGPVELRPVGEIEFIASEAEAWDRAGATVRLAEGVVGFADLSLGARVRELLDAEIEAGRGRMRGVRYSTTVDTSTLASLLPSKDLPPGGINNTEVKTALKLLAELGLTFDCYCYSTQISGLTEAANALPNTSFVLDHTGAVLGVGPYRDRSKEMFELWKSDLRELARCPNVSLKIGGLGMTYWGFDFQTARAPARSAEVATAWRPFIETCIETFGADRCMFESNFPVDKQSCGYTALWNAYKIVTKSASRAERRALFSGTAARVYRLREVDELETS